MAFVEVTKEQFYKGIGGPENIHPTPFEYHCEWKNLATHEIVGRSEPGYKSHVNTAVFAFHRVI